MVWKHYVVHPDRATTPALAACAAQEQGKFFEFEKQVWAKAWEGGRLGDLSEDAMVKIAGDMQLDLDRFKADMKADKCKQDLSSDQQILSRVGTRGTPAFYINGRFLNGAQPIDRFKAVIDEELKKANDAIGKGARAENYYSQIVANGKKTLQ